MNNIEIIKVQNYLRRLFRSETIKLAKRSNKDDSVEVMVDEEFIGIIFRDDEDGEISYSFNMAILEFDLDEAED